MSNKLELVFEFDGPTDGPWTSLGARYNGQEVLILPKAVGPAMGYQVHKLGKDTVVSHDGE